MLKGDSQRFRPFSRTKGGFSIPFLVILPNFGRLRLVLCKKGGVKVLSTVLKVFLAIWRVFFGFSTVFQGFSSHKSFFSEIVFQLLSSFHPDSFSSLGLCSWVFCLSGLFLMEVSIVLSLSGCLLAVQLYPIPLPSETEL